MHLASEHGQIKHAALVLVCKDGVRTGHQLEQLVRSRLLAGGDRFVRVVFKCKLPACMRTSTS